LTLLTMFAVLEALFELVTSKGTSQCTKNLVSSANLAAAIITGCSASNGTHQTSLAFLSWFSLRVVGVNRIWLLIISALLGELA